MQFYRKHERILKKIITSIIPSKSLRTAMTSALKYDGSLWERIKTSRNMRHTDRTGGVFEHFLSVVAIMKNEGPYLREWIEYHRIAGVDKFYLYDNDSTDDTKKILAPYIKSGIVEYNFFPGEKKQVPAYADCIERHKNDTKWLAVIDLDEFIVPFVKKSWGGVLKAF